MMKEITAPTGIELLIVPVPEDSNDFRVTHIQNPDIDLICTLNSHLKHIASLPQGFDYKVLGCVTKNSSFDCRQLVKWNGVLKVAKAVSLFKDLLQSSGVTFENPYGEEPVMTVQYKDHAQFVRIHNQWEAAQKNVVKKVVVIQKLKP